MTDTPLDAYLAELTARGIDARAVAIVRALDRAIRGAGPELESAIKYKILMYGLHGDWRTWVCAVDATTKGVGLRFLYGVILDDPLSVLRAGSSVLKTWDVGFDDAIDAAAVGALRRRGRREVPDLQGRRAGHPRGEPGGGIEAAQRHRALAALTPDPSGYGPRPVLGQRGAHVTTPTSPGGRPRRDQPSASSTASSSSAAWRRASFGPFGSIQS